MRGAEPLLGETTPPRVGFLYTCAPPKIPLSPSPGAPAPDVLMFETEDLVLRKNEKNFVLCLLELARRAARFGMRAPTLVQMEEEIEEELRQELHLPPKDTPLPRPPREPRDLRNLDQMVGCGGGWRGWWWLGWRWWG